MRVMRSTLSAAARSGRLPRAAGTLTLMGALLAPVASAQTAPAPTTPVQTAPVPPAKSAPAKVGSVSAVTDRAVSALAIEVSGVAKGRIVGCPAALKLSVNAVCVYSQSASGTLRPLLKGRLGARASGDWKSSGKSSVLLAAPAGGKASAFVLLSPMSDTETLVVVDALKAAPAPAASAAPKAATPAGVVRGQPYVLGSDLVGVVKVTSLGGGKYRLSTEDDGLLTVTVGAKSAQAAGGAVELPLAPATDGRNLIFPLAGLRALGCTVTPAGSNLTVACGPDSVGLKPIVF
ncbi:hypothetical protein IHN63_15330 [Deinococcus sp. 6YEL10]|nr:hypothetical protein [Deinococcus sp. 6YEL10]MCD0162660.1 hypothetical protein [Deinococcus sp. 6YEL10]